MAENAGIAQVCLEGSAMERLSHFSQQDNALGQAHLQYALKDAVKPTIVGVILAGGKSSRMGQDKALLLQKHGIPLLRHVYDCAAAVCDRVYVITPRQDISRQDIYRPLLPPTCEFIPEGGQYQGPLKAFREAIEFLGYSGLEGYSSEALRFPETRLKNQDFSWILLLSCDLPNLNGSILQDWAQTVVLENPSDAPLAYIPRNPQGWWEPLCGFYSPRCRSSLHQFLETGGRSFQAWLNQESVGILPLPDPQILLNLNTPESIPENTPECDRASHLADLLIRKNAQILEKCRKML